MESFKKNASRSNDAGFVGKDTLETIPDVFIVDKPVQRL